MCEEGDQHNQDSHGACNGDEKNTPPIHTWWFPSKSLNFSLPPLFDLFDLLEIPLMHRREFSERLNPGFRSYQGIVFG